MKKVILFSLLLGAPICLGLYNTNPSLLEQEMVDRILFLSGIYYAVIGCIMVLPVMLLSSNSIGEEEKFKLIKTIYQMQENQQSNGFLKIVFRLVFFLTVIGGFLQLGSYSLLFGGTWLVLSSRLSSAMGSGFIKKVKEVFPYLEDTIKNKESSFGEFKQLLEANGNDSFLK